MKASDFLDDFEPTPQQPTAGDFSDSDQPLTLAPSKSIIGPAPTTSAFGAGTRSLIRNVAPGVAFLRAAPIGAEYGAAAALAIPVIGETGIAELIGGLIGGVASGSVAAWAAHKAQTAIADEAAPDSIFGSKSEETDTAEHPIASEVGQLLAIGRPSPMGVINAAKTLASSEGRAALTEFAKAAATKDGLREWSQSTPQAVQEQIANLQNVAVSGGMNAAFNAYDQLRTGNYSFSDLARSAAEGTLFNKAWIHFSNPATKAFNETADQGREQGGDSDASQITGAAGLPKQPIRSRVGEAAPLQQPGETPGAGTEPSNIQPNAQADALKPRTLFGGISVVPKPEDPDGFGVLVKNKNIADLNYIDHESELPGGVGAYYAGSNGLFWRQDPQTNRPSIYLLKNPEGGDSDPFFTHESVHLLRSLDILTPDMENAILKKYGGDMEPEIRQRYEAFNARAGLQPPTDNDIREEILARLFEDWHRNNNAPQIGFVQRSMNFFGGLLGFKPNADQHIESLVTGKHEGPSLIKYIASNPSGFTINPDTGDVPGSGYVVAPSKLTEMKVKASDFTADVLRDYLYKFRNIFETMPNANIGGWYNADDGHIYLDASVVVDNLHDALHIANNGDQLAIYDLGKQQVVGTKDAIAELRSGSVWSDARGADLRPIRERFDGAVREKGSAQASGNGGDSKTGPDGKPVQGAAEGLESAPIIPTQDDASSAGLKHAVTKKGGFYIGSRFGDVFGQTAAEPPKHQPISQDDFRSARGSLLQLVGTKREIDARGYHLIFSNPDPGTAQKIGVRQDDLMARVIHAISNPDRKSPSPTKIMFANNVENTVRNADYVLDMPRDGESGTRMTAFAKLYDVNGQNHWHLVEFEGTGKDLKFNTQYSWPANTELNARVMKSSVLQVGQRAAGQLVSEVHPQAEAPVLPNSSQPPVIPIVPEQTPRVQPQFSVRRAQVAGIPEVGQIRPSENIEEIRGKIRTAFFDSTKPVTEESTASAWQIFDEMTDPKMRMTNAGLFNGVIGDTRIGLALYKGELMRYAFKMAAHGDPSLIKAMFDHSEDFITSTGGGASTAGSALRGEAEFAGDPVIIAFKKILLEERLDSAQKGSGLNREKFDALLGEIKNIRIAPEELERAIITGRTGSGKKLEELLDEVSPQQKEAERILDKYEQSQTEWLSEPKKISAVRKIIKESLGGLTAKYADQAEFARFVSNRFQEVGVSKEISDRLAFEVWKDKAARESSATAKSVEREGRREQGNAEALINRLEQEQTEWRKPEVRSRVNEIFRQYMKATAPERDMFIGEMSRELMDAGVSQPTSSILAHRAYDAKITADANRRLAAEKAANEAAQKVAERKLAQLQSKYHGAEWLKPEGATEKILGIIRDALNSDAPVDANRLGNAADTSKKLVELGVEPNTAHQLALAIEDERANGFYNRRARLLETASKSNSISGLINEILDTPYSQQQKPGWRKEVAERWFMSRGLDRDQAGAAYRLFSDGFDRAFADARQKVLDRFYKKGIPKSNEDLRLMINSGILDPDQDWAANLAEKTGWRPLTTDEFKRLSELNEKLEDPALSPEEVASYKNQQVNILLHVGKREGANIRAIGEAFTASLLSGIRTMTVQLSPLMMTIRDFPIMAMSDPKNMMYFAKAIQNAYNANLKVQLKYAWQKDAFGYHLNELEHGYNELKRVSDEADRVIADKKALPHAKALAYGKKLYSFQRFVFRTLNTLDQTQMVLARDWKLAYYSSIAFKEAGLKSSDIDNLVDGIERFRSQRFQENVANGLGEDVAMLRANNDVQEYVSDFVNNVTGNETLGHKVVEAAENDVYAMVGRMPEGLSNNDEGFLSKYTGMNWLMNKLSEARSQSGLANIGVTTLFGMVNIPFRSLRFFSEFSPYGLMRYGIYKYRMNTNRDNYWKQTFSNELQARQRFRMALAGTITMALAAAWGWKHHTSDSGAGDEDLGIYFTGRGPDNKVLADAWAKRGWKQYSMNLVIGGHIVAIPLTRAGESLLMPFASAAATDDAAWKVKEAAATGRQTTLASQFASTVIGEYMNMTGQSGILQGVGQFQKIYESGGNVAGKAAAKLATSALSATVLPFKQFLAGVSDMMIGTLDASSIQSIVANQFPIIGLPFQQRAVNRFGDPLYDRSWFGIAARTGIPIAFQVERNPENEALYNSLLNSGAAPPPLSRTTLENKYGPMTDAQFVQFAKASGDQLKASALSNIAALQQATPQDAKLMLNSMANQSDSQAANTLQLAPSAPVAKQQAPRRQAPAKTGRTRSGGRAVGGLRPVKLAKAGHKRGQFRGYSFLNHSRSAFA